MAKLIIFANSKSGRYVTAGEFYRPLSMILLYYFGFIVAKGLNGGLILKKARKRSKTLDSYHGKRLAGDLNLFIGGVYRTDREAYKELAEYWQGLHPDNRAGYFWGWDANHFEMRIP